MRVLVGCESSGKVREAFRRLGHDAWSCDLLPADDGSPHHIQADVLSVIDQGWDIGIFHPPCTYLCSSGLHWNSRGVLVQGRPRAELTEESLGFVRALMAAPIPRIAIENPIGCIGTRIRKADQTIHPWMFGDDASKATCLWLMNLPPLVPTRLVEPRLVCCGVTLPDGVGKYGCPNFGGESKPKRRWSNQTDSGQNKLPPSADRWKLRSETYQGIADAMALQWGRDIAQANDAQFDLFAAGGAP